MNNNDIKLFHHQKDLTHSIKTKVPYKKSYYTTNESHRNQLITACALLALIAPQGAFTQNICPSQRLDLIPTFQREPTCPAVRTENMLVMKHQLENRLGQSLNLELLDPELFDFQEQVLDILNSGKNSYKSADIGVHKSPILYDATSNEPIGIIKGQKGQWFVTCEIGDVIAYKLDYNGYAGVSPAFEITSLRTLDGEKVAHPVGVIVKWISNTRQMTYQEFKTADTEKQQAISILDIRLGNKDRNQGNIQVDNEGRLYPIDHDQIFTEYKRPIVASAVYAERPLTEQTKNYIRSIDINKDIEMLREYHIDEGEIANLVIRTTFLKLAAEAEYPNEINLEYVEDAIDNAKLPTGGLGRFIQGWIYNHPLRKILHTLSEPYDELQLKEAFRDTFHSYITSAKRWSYPTFLIKKIIRKIF